MIKQLWRGTGLLGQRGLLNLGGGIRSTAGRLSYTLYQADSPLHQSSDSLHSKCPFKSSNFLSER